MDRATHIRLFRQRRSRRLRLKAGRNHAGLVDLGTWDRVYLVGILQVRLADTLPDRGVSAPLRRRWRCEGRHRKRQRQDEKILAHVPHGRSPVHLDPYWIARAGDQERSVSRKTTMSYWTVVQYPRGPISGHPGGNA